MKHMPCGECDAGTYDSVPMLRGLAMFGACQSKIEAMRIAPRCKRDDSHICYGALDWLKGAKLPISDDEIRQMARALT